MHVINLRVSLASKNMRKGAVAMNLYYDYWNIYILTQSTKHEIRFNITKVNNHLILITFNYCYIN